MITEIEFKRTSNIFINAGIVALYQYLKVFKEDANVEVKVCVGTSCFVNGSQALLNDIINYIDEKGLKNYVNVKATFCLEKCDKGPSVTIGEELLHHCTLDMAVDSLHKKLVQHAEDEVQSLKDILTK